MQYVICDALSKPAFEAWGFLPYSPGLVLGPDDIIIADAGVRAPGRQGRARHSGLTLLDDILADPVHQPAGTGVFGMEVPTAIYAARKLNPAVGLLQAPDFIPFERHPLTRSRLTSLCARARTLASDAPLLWWLLRLEASSRCLRLSGSRLSHQHKNVISAMRLYVGALQAGYAALGGAKSQLLRFHELEKKLAGEARVLDTAPFIWRCNNHRLILEDVRKADATAELELPEDWHARLRLFRMHEPLRLTRPSRGAGASRNPMKILLLDDGCTTHGWKSVFDSIRKAAGLKLTYAETWAQVPKDNLADFDLMLLDCDLGLDETQSRRPTGLELLAPIRGVTLDLPIIIMTSYDRAELALWALRAGANGFYAKQLDDPEDRHPVEYLIKLLELLSRPEWEGRVRDSWTEFSARLPIKGRFQVDEPAVRYIFYLLFSLCDDAVWWAPGSTRSEAEEWARRAVGVVLGGLETPSFAGQLKRSIDANRHLDSPLDLTNILDAVSIAAKLGMTMKKQARIEIAPRMPLHCPLTLNQLTEAAGDGRAPCERSSLHFRNSRLGALQLVLGCLAARGVETASLEDLARRQKTSIQDALEEIETSFGNLLSEAAVSGSRVALVDDEGYLNGWATALSKVIGPIVDCFPDVDQLLPRLADFDLVLLDLWMPPEPGAAPHPNGGMRALERIKSVENGLPVIVLSAANETLHAIRAVRRGAIDYLPKWRSADRTPSEWMGYYELLLDRIRAGVEAGRHTSRLIWRDLQGLQDPAPVSPLLQGSNAARIEKVANWPGAEPGANAAGRLSALRQTYYHQVVPAMTLCYAMAFSSHLKDRLPPVDVWRVRDVLVGSVPWEQSVVLLCGRAAEFLGYTLYSCSRGQFGLNGWLKSQGDWGGWIARASASARAAWDQRIAARKGASISPADALDCLRQAIRAYRDLESKLASGQW